jgi:hypothetical protein
MCGCHSPSKIWLIPVDTDRLERVAPLVRSFEPTTNHYWVNSHGELCATLSIPVTTGPEPNARQAFDVSLVLAGAPADRGKMYRADQRTMRATMQEGILPSRYASTTGVVRVEFGPAEDTLKIRFRIWANEQLFKIWTGWRSTGPVLFVGDAVATRNATAGQKVLQSTEEEGFERNQPGVPVRVFGPPVEAE